MGIGHRALETGRVNSRHQRDHGRFVQPQCPQSSFLSPLSSSLGPFPSLRTFHLSPFTSHLSPFTPYSLRTSAGFTFLEMLFVLFLLSGVLAIAIPRISVEEDLNSTGRKFVGIIRTLQGLATTGQKPVKLYIDLDQGTYWMMIVDGKEERLPLDPTWKLPRTLPESIRLIELSVGDNKRLSGRADLSFAPHGRLDPIIMYFTDAKNNLLGLVVDSLTGGIRITNERIEPLRNRIIPDRVKTLLKPTTAVGAPGATGTGPLPKTNPNEPSPRQPQAR